MEDPLRNKGYRHNEDGTITWIPLHILNHISTTPCKTLEQIVNLTVKTYPWETIVIRSIRQELDYRAHNLISLAEENQ